MQNVQLHHFKSLFTSGFCKFINWRALQILIAILILNPQYVFSQIKDTVINKAANPKFTYTLFNNTNLKVKVGGYIQPRAQYTEWNPGSTDKNGDYKNDDFGFAVRRLRLGANLTYSDKFLFRLGFGENNFNEKGKDFPYLKILDLYATYNLSKPFAISFGKSTYDGLSRFAAPSTSTMMQTDLNVITQPTLNYTDDITRELSLVFLGDIGPLNYRLVFIKPFSFDYTGANPATPDEGVAQFTDHYRNIQYTTYIKYDFLDKENNRGPNFIGTYLGKKKLLSVGIGAKYQHNALYSETNAVTTYHDMNLWSADMFWDQPVNTSWMAAINGYVGYFDYDLGPNYLRNVGVNNPAFGIDNVYNIVNGSGNAYPYLGSGQSFYGHFGILFNKMGKQTDWGQLEPYVVLQSSDFDALEENMVVGSVGLNWYLNGHYSKFSLDIQNRPLFSEVDLKETDRKYMCVLQYNYILH
ncbi:hypothetical protein FNB79_14600 [Formosa sediminum]|uniref:Porin n=1 Tax=Formosa sediminum TaxID=2594004 RepID=A0A516GUF7_9FLAO|nr:hypothetical protein [Formosa sediminum]QDO95151.1 hypothetical protein FNB79_14600 [Formosa sediminum]